MVTTRGRRMKMEKETPPLEIHQNSGNIHQDYPFSPIPSSRLRSRSTEILIQNSVSSTHWMSSLLERTPSHPSGSLKAAKRVLHDHKPRPRYQYSASVHEDIKIPILPPAVQSPPEAHQIAFHPECTTSLNITEFVKRQQYDTDDDEVQSALDLAFDCVHGHVVKKENAPLLRAIFEKYGDITEESEGKPPTIVSFFLERVCAIYERLKATKFNEVTQKNLNEMLKEVDFLETQKLNLGWLHEKLDYIQKTKMCSKEYLTLKEDDKNSDMIIAQLENELSLLQERLVAEKGKADQIKKKVLDIKKRVDDLRTHSLVDGLL